MSDFAKSLREKVGQPILLGDKVVVLVRLEITDRRGEYITCEFRTFEPIRAVAPALEAQANLPPSAPPRLCV